MGATYSIGTRCSYVWLGGYKLEVSFPKLVTENLKEVFLPALWYNDAQRGGRFGHYYSPTSMYVRINLTGIK